MVIGLRHLLTAFDAYLAVQLQSTQKMRIEGTQISCGDARVIRYLRKSMSI